MEKQLDKKVQAEQEIGLDDAIGLYEQQINNGHFKKDSFETLLTIYRERNQTEDEIRVLQKAIDFYSSSEEESKETQSVLGKFKARLKDRIKEVKLMKMLQW